MERYIDITYTYGVDHTRTVSYPFRDLYDENISYRDNVHYLVAILMDDGGFWVNDNTFVPYHMIVSFFTANNSNSTRTTQPQINSESNNGRKNFRNKYRRNAKRRDENERGKSEKANDH